MNRKSDMNCSELFENLTPREKEVLEAVLIGATDGEVAMKLDISIRTAEKHVANIYRKTGIRRRIELIRVCDQAGCLPPSV